MRLAGVLTALALVSGATCAQASEPQFESFRKVCLETGAAPAAALAAADAAGWEPIPDAVRRRLPPQYGEAEGRARSDAEGVTLLVASTGRLQVGEDVLAAPMCAVGRSPGDFSALSKAMADYAAVPADPALSRTQGLGFAFAEKDGAHVAVGESDPRARDLLRAGKLKMLIAADGGPWTFAVLMIPTR